jgi:soluble lytic murein transglycosylase-like protein
VTVTLALSAAPARADDPVAAARARARAAERDVRALQARLQAADTSYGSALDGLANAVTSQVQAERIADDATLRAEVASRAQRQHLLQVYLSGGTNLLDLTLTDGPVAASEGSNYLMRLVERDRRAVTLAQVERKRAVASAASMDRRASAQIETVGGVQDRYNEVQALLADAQARLQQLDATARSLAQVQALIKELDAQKAAADAARVAAAKRARAGGIPAEYLALYQAAAPTCPGLPWVVLAAIGQVESGHGSNPNDSSAGAQGPMQFLPATFAAFAVDGDGDGITDIRDPADAIYTAAAYLCANHAGRDADGLRGAIYRYNHANWYVELVLNIAAQLAQRYGQPAPPPYVPVA